MNDSYLLQTLAKLIGAVTVSGLVWGIFGDMLTAYIEKSFFKRHRT
jgi:energy-converting hydrogenase Eha subunit A